MATVTVKVKEVKMTATPLPPPTLPKLSALPRESSANVRMISFMEPKLRLTSLTELRSLLSTLQLTMETGLVLCALTMSSEILSQALRRTASAQLELPTKPTPPSMTSIGLLKSTLGAKSS